MYLFNAINLEKRPQLCRKSSLSFWTVRDSQSIRKVSGFPGGTNAKNPSASAGDIRDTGSIPELGRSPAGGTATHCSILAWRIPWTEEPGRLRSIGSHRVGHDWSNLAHMHASKVRKMEVQMERIVNSWVGRETGSECLTLPSRVPLSEPHLSLP